LNDLEIEVKALREKVCVICVCFYSLLSQSLHPFKADSFQKQPEVIQSQI
jgi:hypothetical protein